MVSGCFPHITYISLLLLYLLFFAAVIYINIIFIENPRFEHIIIYTRKLASLAITSEMQSIGRAKHTVLMLTAWPLTILQIVFIGIK